MLLKIILEGIDILCGQIKKEGQTAILMWKLGI